MVNKEQLKQYKNQLLEERQRLLGDLDHLHDSNLNPSSGNGSGGAAADEVDKADADYSYSFNFSLVSNKQKMLSQIDDALDRIEDGSYGTCEGCAVKIPLKRLKAKPFARYCIKCVEKLEAEGLS